MSTRYQCVQQQEVTVLTAVLNCNAALTTLQHYYQAAPQLTVFTYPAARYDCTATSCTNRQSARAAAAQRGTHQQGGSSEPDSPMALFCRGVVEEQCGRHFDALRDFTAALTFCLAACAPHSSSSGTTSSSKLISASSSSNASAVATTAALGPLYFNRAVVRTSFMLQLLCALCLIAVLHTDAVGCTLWLYAVQRALLHSAAMHQSNARMTVAAKPLLLLLVNSVGDDAGARKDLDMAVACDPRCHLYRANRALLTRRCGDYSAAQEDYQYHSASLICRACSADAVSTPRMALRTLHCQCMHTEAMGAAGAGQASSRSYTGS
eukprot:4976-Heterococcus_DN1.PRE.2